MLPPEEREVGFHPGAGANLRPTSATPFRGLGSSLYAISAFSPSSARSGLNRIRFLLESHSDLDSSLKSLACCASTSHLTSIVVKKFFEVKVVRKKQLGSLGRWKRDGGQTRRGKASGGLYCCQCTGHLGILSSWCFNCNSSGNKEEIISTACLFWDNWNYA
ncbi:hypothetical protein J5N97_006429 [Dioscorea zingiberensis]|uniref:Uncharacterized protein n=1 Tax=Dioscorea zingiberensis TaxID=325984 RepID=A0A9D5DBU9_9LILI|nr:hypothetical protein J5N97_006429 [Dioscorea zingiberensis]